MTETPQPQGMPPSPGPGQPIPPAPGAPAKRPGGLTALAVLNFVFGGLGLIGLFALAALLTVADKVAITATEGQVSLTKGQGPASGLVVLMLVVALVNVVLLIASGIGYIGQKRVAGYILGNVYGAVAIVAFILNVAGGQFNFMAILALAYPVLTLILLNTVFKNCFR